MRISNEHENQGYLGLPALFPSYHFSGSQSLLVRIEKGIEAYQTDGRLAKNPLEKQRRVAAAWGCDVGGRT